MSVAGDPAVHVSRDTETPGVAVVTIDFPSRRNAFSLAVRQKMYAALDQLMYHDPSCRAIVLTGAGAAFCAGGDISEMTERTVLESRERSRLTVGIFELMVTGPKPIVAAVEGPAMGAGLALAAASDIVVASREARFCAAFIRVGLLPDTGLYWSLPRRVGGGRARELIMTGREIGGEEALRIGLANQLAEPGAALAAAVVQARRYLAIPPLTQAHVRVTLAKGADSLDQALESEADLQPLMRRTQDHREAVTAFLEKRKPVFVGN